MGALTTHVLDTSGGKPAAVELLDLYRLGDAAQRISSALTNDDGRCPTPLLDGEDFQPGEYELAVPATHSKNGPGLRTYSPPALGASRRATPIWRTRLRRHWGSYWPRNQM